LWQESVAGEYETIYDISVLPEYVLQKRPELAPLPHLAGKGHLIEVVKTRNFSESDHSPSYHFGLTGATDWEPASTEMGHFLSVSRTYFPITRVLTIISCLTLTTPL
jgi:hypothetical protein